MPSPMASRWRLWLLLSSFPLFLGVYAATAWPVAHAQADGVLRVLSREPGRPSHLPYPAEDGTFASLFSQALASLPAPVEGLPRSCGSGARTPPQAEACARAHAQQLGPALSLAATGRQARLGAVTGLGCAPEALVSAGAAVALEVRALCGSGQREEALALCADAFGVARDLCWSALPAAAACAEGFARALFEDCAAAALSANEAQQWEASATADRLARGLPTTERRVDLAQAQGELREYGQLFTAAQRAQVPPALQPLLPKASSNPLPLLALRRWTQAAALLVPLHRRKLGATVTLAQLLEPFAAEDRALLQPLFSGLSDEPSDEGMRGLLTLTARTPQLGALLRGLGDDDALPGFGDFDNAVRLDEADGGVVLRSTRKRLADVELFVPRPTAGTP